MTRRACVSCGAYLRAGNTSDACWPCQPHDVPAVGEVRRYNSPWTREEAAGAIRRWTEWMGRPPRKVDWEKTRSGEPTHPTSYSVYKLWDTWPEALAYAGEQAAAPLARPLALLMAAAETGALPPRLVSLIARFDTLEDWQSQTT